MRRSVRWARRGALAAALAVAGPPLVAQAGGGAPPGPPRNPPRSAQGEAKGDGDKTKPVIAPFAPKESTWARFSEMALPKEPRAEPTVDELAARFGLEKLAPRADGIVEWREPKVGMRFVFVPGGTFRMGSNHGDIFTNGMVLDAAMRAKVDENYFTSEQPQVEIYLSPFFIGVHEVTNREYRAFLAEWRAGKVPVTCEWPLILAQPDHSPYLEGLHQRLAFDGDELPACGVTWLDSFAFSRWLGGRMPSEAEWEKAARGTDGRIFPWGNLFDPMRLNCAESQNKRTTAVGTYPGGRSPYGCFDMAGNVAEYCLDAFEETLLRNVPRTNPCLLERHPARDKRVQRGGSWNRYGLLFKARTSARGFGKIVARNPDPARESLDSFPIQEYLFSGFRVVLSPLQELFPDGEVERLLAQATAVRDQRLHAINQKRAQSGKPPLGSLPTLPGTTPEDEDEEPGELHEEGGAPAPVPAPAGGGTSGGRSGG
jgi:formylglycine-generating enzyme required for sulfatase activity